MDKKEQNEQNEQKEARSKLKQRMNAERLKRSSGMAKRSFLEKKKVPTELIDSCMNQINQKKPLGPALQNMLQSLQSNKSEANPMNAIQSMNPETLRKMLETVAKSSPERSQELNAMLQNLQNVTDTLQKSNKE